MEIHFSQRILVGLARFLGLIPGFFLVEARVFPCIHGRNGMIRRGEIFFCANGRYPLLHRILVGLAQPIQFRDVRRLSVVHGVCSYDMARKAQYREPDSSIATGSVSTQAINRLLTVAI